MSISTEFFDWGAHAPGDFLEFRSKSPNLRLVTDELRRRWACSVIGCYNPVLIPGTAVWSTHAFGAACDVRYYPNQRPDEVYPGQMIGFLIGWSNELHVQAVHDYVRQRIWRAGRTPNVEDACSGWWKAQRTSPSDPMGKSWATWLHVETTKDGWYDDTPLAERGVL